MPAAKGRSKSQSQVRAFVHNPVTQYISVFLAAYVVFFIAGLITSLVPIFDLLPQPATYPSTSPDYVAYNVWVVAVQSFLPTILFGAGFWLFGHFLIALGAKHPKRRALWLGAAAASVLFLLLITTTTMLSILGYLDFSADNQAIFDLTTIPLMGLMYVIGWWVVRSRH